MRQWVTPRSLMLHVAFVAIAAGCLIAGWWQVHRAMSGNTLSYLYSIEWPAFAIVAGIGWWQMFHDTPEDLARRREHHVRARAASAAVVARTLPRSALAITVTSEEAGTTALSQSTAAALESGFDGPDSTGLMHAPDSLPAVAADKTSLLEEEIDPTDELAAYNRYLALLAVQGKAKTWRNPHGT